MIQGRKIRRRRKEVSVKSCLSEGQKAYLNTIRHDYNTTYADIVRGALYEKYPELRSM